MKSVLETSGLTVRIGTKLVCHGLDLRVMPDTRWAILGINGVGKTTLLHTLRGLHPPQAGEIWLNEKPLRQMRPREAALVAGLLLQDSEDRFSSTLLETALIGRHPHVPGWQGESAEDEAIAWGALAAVGLRDIAHRKADTLSGGERRRLAIATLLTQNPQLYLLDEPTNHLDLPHQLAMLELLSALTREQNKALVMTLHDVNLAVQYSDHALLLFGDGESMQGATSALLTETNLTRLYQHPITVIFHNGRRWFIPA